MHQMITKQETQLTNAEAFTPEQLKLIRDTIARNATPDELQLFLYRAKVMGLDPLKPGQIHFVKYGNSPGTVVVGIEGFRTIAHRSGKLAGIKRGVKHDADGNVTYGWAEVRRKDWTDVAYEEVPFSEYAKNGNWKTMPETMIKKVAEAAALRMAFPNELGGVMALEEMDQAKPQSVVVAEEEGAIPVTGVSPTCYGQPEKQPHETEYAMPFGIKWPDASGAQHELKGLSVERIAEKVGTDQLEKLVTKFENVLSGKEPTRMVMTDQRKSDMQEFLLEATAYFRKVDGRSPDFDE
jgi:phage recombination protein Bet